VVAGRRADPLSLARWLWVASSLGGAAREIVLPVASGEVISATWSRTGDSIAVVRSDSLLVFSRMDEAAAS
jgi:hypothetical protein